MLIPNPYDEFPYQTDPQPRSQPEHLYTLLRHYGASPSPIENSRVLELGCGDGGNILPLASRYPQAEFVGIDYSSQSIANAELVKAKAALKNITFLCADLSEVPPFQRPFDYIICHGTLSWVSRSVQDAIGRLCATSLASNGVFYCSYNALPGWNIRKIFRDLSLRYAANDPQVRKASRAKEILSLLSKHIRSQDGYDVSFFKSELASLSQMPDWFLTHDLLEETNEPFLFSELEGRFVAQGLQYVCDADVVTNFTQEFSPEMRKFFESFDPTNREQYLDYFRLRMFRRSIFVKQGQSLSNTISPLPLQHALEKNLSISGDFELHPATALLREKRFFTKQGGGIKTQDPLLSLALETVGRAFPAYVSFRELLSQQPVSQAQFEEQTYLPLVSAYQSGLLELQFFPPLIAREISNLPKAFDLSQLYAEFSEKVPNVRHESASLTQIERAVLRMCDGKSSSDVLLTLLQSVGGKACSPNELQTILLSLKDKALLIS